MRLMLRSQVTLPQPEACLARSELGTLTARATAGIPRILTAGYTPRAYLPAGAPGFSISRCMCSRIPMTTA
jgi:hypothetical protein